MARTFQTIHISERSKPDEANAGRSPEIVTWLTPSFTSYCHCGSDPRFWTSPHFFGLSHCSIVQFPILVFFSLFSPNVLDLVPNSMGDPDRGQLRRFCREGGGQREIDTYSSGKERDETGRQMRVCAKVRQGVFVLIPLC